MKTILGLDLGTTSIGWALVREAEREGEQSSIVKLGVRVNPLTVDEIGNFEKGRPITTNADRTLKRGMRRNLQRYKLRRAHLIDALKKYGLITNESILCEEGNATTFETYRLRARAATEPITSEQLARVLLMINKKRGYKSNRKAKKTDEDGLMIDGMEVAKRLYEEELTPAQLSLRLLTEGKKKLPDYYPSDLKAELETIWRKQQEYYPEELTDDLFAQIIGKSTRVTSMEFQRRYGIYTPTVKPAERRRQSLEWRVAALSGRLDIGQVVFAIGEINGQIDGSSGLLGRISDRNKELYFGGLTVGQYMMKSLDEDPNRPLRNMVFYRRDYLDEFERIWETQAAANPLLTPEAKRELRDIVIFYQRPLKSKKGLVALCELLSREMEVVTDGKTQKRLVGPKVCPKSSPLYQEFRIWQRINDLRIIAKKSGEEFLLNEEQREMLAKELELKVKMNKAEMLKLLMKQPKDWDLNFKEVDGNRTMCSIYGAIQQIIALSGHEEQDFSKMSADRIHEVVDGVCSTLGIDTAILRFDSGAEGRVDDQPFYQLWHLLYSYEDDSSRTGDEALIKKLKSLCGIQDDETAKVLAAVSFEDDYGSISARAIRRILPYMKEGFDYSEACEKAGLRHSKRSLSAEELAQKAYVDRLELLPRGALRNPVVEKILNQMIHVVNGLIEEYGRPDEIRIEMARDLKKSAKERKEATDAISKNTKEAEEVRELLKKEFGIANPSRNDVIRYRLYQELESCGFKTLYSQTYIPREKLFSKEFDIEHILPQARFFDDSFGNKTLEARQVNIDKGDQTALDFVKARYGAEGEAQYRERVLSLYKNGKISKTKCDRLLTPVEKIPEGFIDRDLRDTQYIARQAREILEAIVPQVVATTGSVTDRLREDWGLIDVMKELNWEKYDALGLTERLIDRDGRPIKRIREWTKRNDHRHHAMDALTIAFTKRCFIQFLNNLNARSDKGGEIFAIERRELVRDEGGHLRFRAPMPNFRAEAMRHLDAILISIKAKNKVATRNVNRSKQAGGAEHRQVALTPRGQLHNETIYGSSRYYKHSEVKVDGKMTAEVIAQVASRPIREALSRRLEAFGGDPKKAFSGKNSIEKNPIWLDAAQTVAVPAKVKVVQLATRYTIRKPVSPDLKVDKVIDSHIRQILEARLARFGGDPKKAFVNLEEDPIWLNEERGIAIKRVTIVDGVSDPVSLHIKHDHHGEILRDSEGTPIPTDFVKSGNNHHVAIFRDAEGNLQEHLVSFFEAMASQSNGDSIVDKNYKAAEGWTFLFTMKQNEYFVLPDPEHGFDPNEVDLLAPDNYPIVSRHLYRIQTISSKDYRFRHHLETTVEDKKELQGMAWVRIRSLEGLKGIVKVRIDHLGRIVSVGEY